MKDSLEVTAEWFIPNSKEIRIKGILRFDGTHAGSSLELLGSFDEDLYSSDLKNEDIIQGITSDYKEYTLVNCYNTRASGASKRRQYEVYSPQPLRTYRIEYILKGALIDTIENVKFQKIESDFYYLHDWLNNSGFEIFDQDHKDGAYEINLKYREPSQIKFKIDENLEGEFRFEVNRPFSSLGKKILIEQNTYVSLNSKKSVDIETLLSHNYVFQNFLVLACLSPTHPKTIYLSGEKHFKKLENFGDSIKITKHIQLYVPVSKFVKNENLFETKRLLFTYHQIENNFENLIKNWFLKNKSLDPTFNLFFSWFYINERYLESSFLNISQTAETLHAKVFKGQSKPDSKCIKTRDELLKILPEEYHDFIDKKSNCHAVLLSTRLSELVAKYATECVQKHLGDTNLFVNQVVSSRNYYTHFGSGSKSKSLHGTALINLSDKIRVLLLAAILTETGFEKEKINHIISEGFSLRLFDF